MTQKIISKNEEIDQCKLIFDNYYTYFKKEGKTILISIVAVAIEVIFLFLEQQLVYPLLSNLFYHYAYTNKKLSKWGYFTIYIIFIIQQIYISRYSYNLVDLALQILATLCKSVQLIFYFLKATPLNLCYLKICFNIYLWYILFMITQSYLVSLIQISIFICLDKIKILTFIKYCFFLFLIFSLNYYQYFVNWVIFSQLGQILSIAIYINEKNNLKQRVD
ncbi:transmembrane protein, putative (macronuclear) [Tetrahymena thermophila SB210]|uniref:Transmembrane protein, putative n=1 Tax=Tetrahymena thermophila (strain SB210) TaxID=312017 RepID=W7XLC5_TETTS|nr:transmembrane protein, putative [Tetrahymena thermophila SB210]EWS76049.1 transmembrane protein, putative [Tetrahymena thermophila SB210]|eukprot:XP_012651418.1 transmembrane protein, putative [Tetrahymena thermophila SB210]